VITRHYHVIERKGTTDRVVATFASAFQAGRDTALREQALRGSRRDADVRDGFPSRLDLEADAAQPPAPPRTTLSYVGCSCSLEEAATRP
jgi:hypothetical protein